MSKFMTRNVNLDSCSLSKSLFRTSFQKAVVQLLSINMKKHDYSYKKQGRALERTFEYETVTCTDSLRKF